MNVRTVAVIGAGPAGSAAATLLARAGLDVTLIEAKAFPRAKVCGEYVSPAATDILERLLSPDELRAAGATRPDRFVLQLGTKSREWRTPTPAWGLSRRTLDALLVEQATAAGAVVRQPASVRTVAYHDERVTLTLAEGDAIEADLVIHADGVGRHDPAGPTPMIDGVVGHKCHARLPNPVPGVGMRAGNGAYLGTITVEDGVSTIALAASRAHIARHRGDADAMCAALWPGYDAAYRDGPWLACGVARSRYVEPGHPRSVRLGNAAGAVDPVGGEGIGLALWSAAACCDLLGAHDPITTETLAHAKREFARAYRARLRWRLPACRLGAAFLSRPLLVRAAWPLLAAPELTIRPWYRLTGKPASTRPRGAPA